MNWGFGSSSRNLHITDDGMIGWNVTVRIDPIRGLQSGPYSSSRPVPSRYAAAPDEPTHAPLLSPSKQTSRMLVI